MITKFVKFAFLGGVFSFQTLFAESCPEVSQLSKSANNIITGADSQGRIYSYNDSSGRIDFDPSSIVFTNVSIVNRMSPMKVSCVYYNTKQNSGFNMSITVQTATPRGSSWDSRGNCASPNNNPIQCQYNIETE